MIRIKELREINGLTQNQIAIKLGVNQTVVGKYERYQIEPNLETLNKLADIFECSIDYLLGRTDELGNISINANLTNEENELLCLFRKLSELRQEAMLDTMRGLVRIDEDNKAAK